jgi:acetate kinase
MSKTMLALNSGSSSIKFGLFSMANAEPTYLFAGEVADIGDQTGRAGNQHHPQGTAAAAQPAPKARNVVLVHGLFADGSSWSEVIARLEAAGLNATSVQNPLTTLPEAVVRRSWSGIPSPE